MRNSRIKIPKKLYSDLTDETFKNCLVCNEDLMSSRVPYMVEKAFKKGPSGTVNTIFEFAICMPCAQKTQDQMSRESLQKIQNYFMERSNLQNRAELNMVKESFGFEDCIEDCVLSGESIQECDEYQVLALCQGDEMEMGVFPYAISGAEAEKMQDLLSEKTKDELDDFMNTFLDLPPELKMLLEESSTLILV